MQFQRESREAVLSTPTYLLEALIMIAKIQLDAASESSWRDFMVDRSFFPESRMLDRKYMVDLAKKPQQPTSMGTTVHD